MYIYLKQKEIVASLNLVFIFKRRKKPKLKLEKISIFFTFLRKEQQQQKKKKEMVTCSRVKLWDAILFCASEIFKESN